MRALQSLMRVCALALAASLAAAHAADDSTIIAAIKFKGGTIDRNHGAAMQGWTISFASPQPTGAFPARGMELHGLACARGAARPTPCFLLMAMHKIESRPHFCELISEDRRGPQAWAITVECPTEIDWRR